MEIIIAGAGSVGYNLAKTLSTRHNVVVIDKSKLALSSMNESLDILPINGDVEDPSTYQKLLGVGKKYDLFVAVTDSDEANLISVIIAREVIDVETTIIRLHNHFFAKSSMMEKFGITEAIFPVDLTSKTIDSLLKYPRASNVKEFDYTDKKLISLKVTKLDGPVEIFPKGYVIAGIDRGGDLFVSTDSEVIYPNDLIYLFGDDIAIHHFCKDYGDEVDEHIENIAIFGAGELGVAIAKTLLDEGKEVKVIDRDSELCSIADEELEGRAMTLNCKYGTAQLYEDEGLKHADVVIVATNNDEYNIIKAVEAKKLGIKKVIVVNNDLEHYDLMRSLDLIIVRGPKVSAYNAVLEKINSKGAVIGRNFCGGKGRVFLYKVNEDSLIVGKTVATPKEKEGIAIYLLRDGDIELCKSEIVCLPEDVVVAFSTQEMEEEVTKWLEKF